MSSLAAAITGITGVLSEFLGVTLAGFEIKDRVHKHDEPTEMDELRQAVVNLAKRTE